MRSSSVVETQANTRQRRRRDLLYILDGFCCFLCSIGIQIPVHKHGYLINNIPGIRTLLSVIYRGGVGEGNVCRSPLFHRYNKKRDCFSFDLMTTTPNIAVSCCDRQAIPRGRNI